MAFSWTSTLLQSILVLQVQAARRILKVTEVTNRVNPLALLLSDGEVCGGRQIHDMLFPKDAMSMRSTQWSQISAVAESHLKEQSALISQLQADIERLTQEIEEKEKAELPNDLASDEISSLITSVLASSERFGSIDSAKASKCGFARLSECRKLNPPVMKGAFRSSVAAFEEMIEERMGKKDARTSAAAVTAVCKQMLSAGEPGETFCDELCQNFASLAQAASDKAVGVAAGRSADDLRAEAELKTKQLNLAVASQGRCLQAQDLLKEFQQQLQPLETSIREARDKSQAARDALDEAEDQLMELEEVIEAQAALTEEKVKALQSTNEQVKDAKAKLAEVRAQEFTVKTRMSLTTKKFGQAKAALEASKSAESSANQLKTWVTHTMMSMAFYFSFAVQDPLSSILDPYVTTDGTFDADAMFALRDEGKVRGPFKESMTDFDRYCELTAKPAFARMDKSAGDMSKLCDFGGVDASVSGVDGAIANLAKSIKSDLSKAAVWLDKYYGQEGMTDELADEYVRAGEPGGLRLIMGPYDVEGELANGYLGKWKKDGPFLQLLAQMGEALEEAAQVQADLQKSLEGLIASLREVEAKRSAARQALAEATKANGIAAEEKTAAEALLASQNAEAEAANTRLDELQAAADLAWRQFQEAKVTMESVFKAGTQLESSFLQETGGLRSVRRVP